MKLFAIIAVALLAVSSGCQKPDPIIMDSGESAERIVEVTAFPAPDTNQTRTTVDTTGVSPLDGPKYGAQLLIVNVEYDAGAAGSHTESFSSVFFADRSRPVVINGTTHGFFGLDLGPAIAINGVQMIRLQYRIPFPGVFRDTASGFIYAKDLSGIHQPNTAFRWDIPFGSSIGSFNISITTPDNVHVVAPAGGSILSRKSDLLMRWTGGGNLNVVISMINPLTKKTRPLMNLHPRLNTGRAIVDARVWELLPPERFYVFTFIISKRAEVRLGTYAEYILAQAASVHNSYVEFQ